MIAHEPEVLMAVEKYKLLLDLWKYEERNSVNLLVMLMVANSLLVPGFFLAGKIPWIALVGCLFSLVWLFMLGHSLSLERHWQAQMEVIRERGANYGLFQIHHAGIRHSIWGEMLSRYYLLGLPLLATVAWLAALLFSLLRS
jgi:hypothetical protein